MSAIIHASTQLIQTRKYHGAAGMGKILIIFGLVIMLLGVVIHFFPGNGLPRLPGDIYIKEDNYTFYFPLGWSVLLSIVISLAFWLFNK